MFRLAQKERWVDLPHGVRLLVVPITTVLVAAAQASARRRALELLGKEDLPESETLRRGVALMLTIQALGRECIRAWQNVVDEDGEEVPLTSAAVDMLLSHEEMAFSFFDAVMSPLRAVDAEGNASGLAPRGTAEAGQNIAGGVPVSDGSAE